MKLLQLFTLLPFLFCLFSEAKPPKKNGRTTAERSKERSPASQSNSGNDGKECFIQADGSCNSNMDELDARQVDNGDRQRRQEQAAFHANMPKEEFVEKCLQSTSEATEDDCSRAWVQNNPAAPTQVSGDEENCRGPVNQWDATLSLCRSVATGEEVKTDADGNSNNKQTEQESQARLCESAHQSAMNSCDSESQSWMSNINMVADIGGPALSQAKPTASTCSGIAAASVGAKGSLAAFAVMCNNASRTCLSSCTTPTDAQSVANLKECKAKATSAQQAQQRIQSAVQSLQSSVATCQAAFGDINGQAQAHCQVNPSACAINMPGGITGSAIPADQAGGAMNPGLNSNGAGGATGSGSGFNLSNIGDDGEEGIGQIAPSKPGEDIGGAKGGAGVAGGGSGQGGDSSGGSGGGKKEGLLSNILSGFFGGGGGSGGGGFKSWFGGGNKGDAYSGNQPKARKGTPDLRQFLPGGANDPNRHRGIAGQFIGRDGMTGPHSDIWKNINNRYQNKRASLLP